MILPGKFVCNVCGALNERPSEAPSREAAGCACLSTVRIRGMVALLSQELFGTALAIPDFPAIKSVRGIGMSDPPVLASRLAEKLDYVNTFYHESPHLDVRHPDESDLGRYDFIISSEVMEHVPAPVEQAFANLCRMLKPAGFLVLTTPYGLSGRTIEHYPELHDYSLASPGGRTVLVNRRRDGTLEVFEDLTFHGGHGSTLEMRVFSEDTLRRALLEAGFCQVHIAAEDVPEYGVQYAESWSLPMIARKAPFPKPVTDVALAYRDLCERHMLLDRELNTLRGYYARHIEFHKRSHAEWERESAERAEWVARIEREFQERTQWALGLNAHQMELENEVRRLQSAEAERRETIGHLEGGLWTRLRRKLRGRGA